MKSRLVKAQRKAKNKGVNNGRKGWRMCNSGKKNKIENFLSSRSLCARAREQEVVIFLTVHKTRLVRELQLKLWKVLVLFVQTPRFENLR